MPSRGHSKNRAPVKIRSPIHSDAPVLLEMVHALAKHHDDKATLQMSDLTRDLFSNPAWVTALVAEVDKQLVGYTILCPLVQLQFGARGMDMHHLFVEQKFRGSGIGRELIDAAVEEAIRQGCRYVTVGTHPDNTAAQRIYLTAGFEAIAPPGPRFRKRLAM